MTFGFGILMGLGLGALSYLTLAPESRTRGGAARMIAVHLFAGALLALLVLRSVRLE